MEAIKVASSAYHLLDSMRWLEFRVYPLLGDLSHRMSGSTISRNNRDDRGSPWRVSRKILMRRVYPCGV